MAVYGINKKITIIYIYINPMENIFGAFFMSSREFFKKHKLIKKPKYLLY